MVSILSIDIQNFSYIKKLFSFKNVVNIIINLVNEKMSTESYFASWSPVIHIILSLSKLHITWGIPQLENWEWEGGW